MNSSDICSTSAAARILVAEDDTDINNLIRTLLHSQGYKTAQAFSGTEAKLRLDMEHFDLLILDLMLPGMAGEELLLELRRENREELSVLVLSAKAALSDKVKLLTCGADDYMTKPFEPEELLARVFACLRRNGRRGDRGSVSSNNKESGEDCREKAENEGLSYKNLRLLPEARKVTVKGEEIRLTRYEYEILNILIQTPEKVYSRETLYEMVWQGGYYGEDNTVNVHVSNLRKKLAAKDAKEEYIKTVWGIGFKMA